MKQVLLGLSILFLTHLLQTKAEGFCPERKGIFCYGCSDKCFTDDDCPHGDLCCKENCGNDCRAPSPAPTKGEHADGPYCKGRFCPDRIGIFCKGCTDRCFREGDCPNDRICCKENCGNRCRPISPFPTKGQPADGPYCKEAYCPRKLNIDCIRPCRDKCYSKKDCGPGSVCCKEKCGNQCRQGSVYPTNGELANGPFCRMQVEEDEEDVE